MIRLRTSLGLLAPAMAVLITGCSELPTLELNAAQQTIDATIAAKAELYASEKLNEARIELEHARREIQEQNDSFVLSRDYELAVEALGEAEARAEEAIVTARTNKEETIDEVSQLLDSASSSMAATLIAFQEAPSGKGTEADLAAIRADLDTLTGNLYAAQALADSGDYLEAKLSLEFTLEGIDAIATELSQATARAE